MKIAAIDSSGLVASVAILDGETILATYSVNYKKTHSQTLLPMLAEITQMTEFEMNTLDAIAVAKGPGSFTGLRIGSATAKGLGQALEKPIIEVPTLDAMAYQLYAVERVICPMMDARRGQVYTGLYCFKREDGTTRFIVLEPQCATAVEDVIEKVNTLGRPVIYLGDGVPVHEAVLKEKTKVDFEFAPACCNRQDATALASLAAIYYEQGNTVSAAAHRPDYLRLSQAERERLEKEGKSNG
ncbi:MAG: tRNA (adenosine(37)-N6)-threonylcarbamoyltransferase complex dimerization subunit type 1 TsaB [Lachnospiraceae bacterium]|nr:tRNA (adenosine(37)-N6)-threonylcarbamoyltransferase complex dimerization subunit type 1 TsaB [Lachnospiraceae bacterium]